MTIPSGNENAFLGALVGVAIGDALGLPVRGMSRDEIAERYGEVTGYLELPEGVTEDGQPVKGMISDKTEFALCMIESLTTNEGELDPENINARLSFLTESPSRQWMTRQVQAGIQEAYESDGLVASGTESESEIDVAVRGIPIGLLHSIGEMDQAALRADSETAARLTHGDDVSARLVEQVALAVSMAARYVDRKPEWGELGPLVDHPLADRIASVVDAVSTADVFETPVLAAVAEGGEAESWGAIAGGIAGARFGAAGLPQFLIDDLDARIYLSMAAPWFYRMSMRKHGLVLDLTDVENEFPG